MGNSDRQQHNDNRATAIVRDWSNWVNVMGHDNRTFADAVMSEHRTIQQQIFETMLTCISAWASTENHDLRNEFTVLKSREIMALFPGGPSTPFI